MQIEDGIKLDYSDVLIRPKRSTLKSRADVDLEREFTFKWCGKKWKGIPVISSNMDGTGTFEIHRVLYKYKMLTCIVKHYSMVDWQKSLIEGINKDYTIISTGISNEDWEKTKKIVDYLYLNWICIDVANGYSKYFIDFCKKVRDYYPDKIIIAGNVVTADMTQELILNGVDICKIGIGSSGVCTTRLAAGVGFPQLSAVIECADAAHGLGGHIIADGGCTCPGDVAKAFGANSDFVMLGSMLAGHDEGQGEIFERTKKKFVKFYGMSSETAQNLHNGGLADYRSSEGRTVEVLYKGPVENTVKDILGGLRSCCTYVGARRLKDLPKCTTFIKVNRQYNNIFEGEGK